MSRFTDKSHLATYAYGDAQRLAARGAMYRLLQIESIELGPYPSRGADIVGVVSTHLDPSLRGNALDIGCGNGKYLPLLASQFDRVVATDLSAGMLTAVPDGSWNKVVADVEATPFADSSFDVVFANHMLYHCPDIARAVVELRRVVRPSQDGGLLIATTNGDGNMSELYELLAKAASDVVGQPKDPLVPADFRFTIETGAAALHSSFDDVRVHRTRGALVIDDESGLEMLRNYYRSTDDEWTSRYGVDWPDLAAALNNVLDQEMKANGVIRIRTSTGVLVAR